MNCVIFVQSNNNKKRQNGNNLCVFIQFYWSKMWQKAPGIN